MAPALDFAIAVARGACDPTFANEHGDPRKAYRKDYPYAYPLDLSAPKLRAQENATLRSRIEVQSRGRSRQGQGAGMASARPGADARHGIYRCRYAGDALCIY